MTCDRCGEEIVISAWPWCPHSIGHAVSVIDDTLEGGPRVFETMGHDGVFIESKSQWRREIAARNLEHVDRHDSAYHAKWRKMHEERQQDERRH